MSLRQSYAMRYPACGQNEALHVFAVVMCELTEDGCDPDRVDGTHWHLDEESFCRCPVCDHKGAIGDFELDHA